MEALAIEVGSVLGGKFRVVRELGVGGMGAVYEVEHTITKHRRALKLLHREMAAIPDIVTRFLREASAAGHIGNPHVVETFDAGQLESGEPYLVMELLKGRTLSNLIEQRRTLGIVEATEILLQACDGVSAAHAAGIVHRDLKPDNLFLVHGSQPFVKILDFGISKFDPALTGAQGITQVGSTMGTPFYMPPEQVRGEHGVDPQADIYALGVILYECLSGMKPYYAETLPHLAVLIAEGKYTPPSVLRPGLPAECDTVIGWAMASDRGSRYRSVAELAEALETLRQIGIAAGEQSIEIGATVPLGSPGANPPLGVPQRSLFPPGASHAPPIPAAARAAAPAPAAAGIPEHTSAPLSRTAPLPGTKRKRSVAPWVVLAVLALGVALVLVLQREPPAPGLASALPVASPSPVHAAPEPASPEPVAPSPAAPSANAAPEPSASAPRATVAPSANAAGAREKASRAKSHGLSEENPF